VGGPCPLSELDGLKRILEVRGSEVSKYALASGGMMTSFV
jgi:hypothetical protein